MYRLAVALSILLCAFSTHADPREDALVQFEKFFAYFATDNHEQLMELFSDDAVFVGTIAPELTTTRDELRAYFVRALSSSRGEVRANLFGTTATALSDDVVLVSATWQSERTKDGQMTTNGPSRNTSVMHKRGERWYIVQFHNSWKPK
jgi:uncharacterized protein (TIGR02246 family)